MMEAIKEELKEGNDKEASKTVVAGVFFLSCTCISSGYALPFPPSCREGVWGHTFSISVPST